MSTNKPTLTLEEIKEKLQRIMDANNYRKGTRDHETCEYSFLQGMIAADNRYVNECPVLTICLLTPNRSIFDF